MRTAGSHGLFDVICVGKDTRFIQVKTTRGDALRAAHAISHAALDPTNRYEIWYKKNRKWMTMKVTPTSAIRPT
jgi:hypothetical protein